MSELPVKTIYAVVTKIPFGDEQVWTRGGPPFFFLEQNAQNRADELNGNQEVQEGVSRIPAGGVPVGPAEFFVRGYNIEDADLLTVTLRQE